MEIQPRFIKSIQIIGGCLFLGGGALAFWALTRFEELPNYMRLAAFVPFAFGAPMFIVNNYFSGWASLSPLEKGRSIACAFAPFIILLGALWWYLQYPAAKA